MSEIPPFPPGFTWGVATAAYQIEGAVREDGRGPSIWDTFCARPGVISDGSSGEVACDHYHRYAADVALMAGLGVDAYRFSIAWPRVLPTGSGPVNTAGLDFYDRLVDELVAAGIEPVPTLYHWDLPQALEDEGGWLNRETAYRFAEYCGIVADRLGDRVRRWITLNEPFIHMSMGYAIGLDAPGRQLLLDALPAAHHLLLGHGLATGALRARGAAEVILTNNYSPTIPETEADRDAAAGYDALHNRLFTDPVLLGEYPDLSAFGVTEIDAVRDGDIDVISAEVDGIGVNYYMPTLIRRADGELPFDLLDYPGVPTTGFGWPVVPGGLHDLLVGLRDRYPNLPPLLITENGCSYPDEPAADGSIDDAARIEYLDGHLRALRSAIADGVDVRGYFVWSLIDNFEWAHGFGQRFGLVHVDYASQRRTPKRSYAWLRDLIAADHDGREADRGSAAR